MVDVDTFLLQELEKSTQKNSGLISLMPAKCQPHGGALSSRVIIPNQRTNPQPLVTATTSRMLCSDRKVPGSIPDPAVTCERIKLEQDTKPRIAPDFVPSEY